MVIRNSSPGLFVGGGVTPVAGRFLVAVSQADGVAIAALSQPNRASLTWTSTRVNAPNPTGGLMSSFSSYGPTAVLGLKPDLGAPGGFIRSTYPLELGGYTVLSGTSMSSPHVAGAAALLEQAHPSLPAASFRDVLMNSASPAPWSLGPQYGIADYVFRQGAGMINIPASIGAQTTITPSKVALGEGSGGPFTLHLQNGSSHPVTYDVAYEEGLGAGPPGMPFGWTFLLADTKASLPATVTVPGSGSAAVTGSLAADPTLDPTSLYGGWVTFTSQEDGQVLRVPIMGLAGDYQAIVAMPTVDLGGGFRFPSIGKEVSPGSFDLLPATQGGTWGLTGPSDIPNVLVHFDHQVQLLRMQVVNAGSGRPVHPVFSYFVHSTLLPRNSTGTGFFAYPWDGTRMQDNGKGTPDHRKVVPDGQYKIVVTALKALGNPANASDWETYTSPTITIDRP